MVLGHQPWPINSHAGILDLPSMLNTIVNNGVGLSSSRDPSNKKTKVWTPRLHIIYATQMECPGILERHPPLIKIVLSCVHICMYFNNC